MTVALTIEMCFLGASTSLVMSARRVPRALGILLSTALASIIIIGGVLGSTLLASLTGFWFVREFENCYCFVCVVVVVATCVCVRACVIVVVVVVIVVVVFFRFSLFLCYCTTPPLSSLLVLMHYIFFFALCFSCMKVYGCSFVWCGGVAFYCGR